MTAHLTQTACHTTGTAGDVLPMAISTTQTARDQLFATCNAQLDDVRQLEKDQATLQAQAEAARAKIRDLSNILKKAQDAAWQKEEELAVAHAQIDELDEASINTKQQWEIVHDQYTTLCSRHAAITNEATEMQSQLDSTCQLKVRLEQDLAKAKEENDSLEQSIKEQQQRSANLQAQAMQDYQSHRQQIAQIEAARLALHEQLARVNAEMASHANPLQDSPPSTPQPGTHAKAAPCIAPPGVPPPPPIAPPSTPPHQGLKRERSGDHADSQQYAYTRTCVMSLASSSTPQPASDVAASVERAAVDVAHTEDQTQPRAQTTLVVSNIPSQCNYIHIQELFYSKVQYYPLVKLRQQHGRSTSMAWIRLRNQQDAARCLEQLHGLKLSEHQGHFGLKLAMAYRELQGAPGATAEQDLLILKKPPPTVSRTHTYSILHTKCKRHHSFFQFKKCHLKIQRHKSHIQNARNEIRT